MYVSCRSPFMFLSPYLCTGTRSIHWTILRNFYFQCWLQIMHLLKAINICRHAHVHFPMLCAFLFPRVLKCFWCILDISSLLLPSLHLNPYNWYKMLYYITHRMCMYLCMPTNIDNPLRRPIQSSENIHRRFSLFFYTWKIIELSFSKLQTFKIITLLVLT